MILLPVFLLICALPYVSSAALLYFDPDVSSVKRGDLVMVDLRLDVENEECVNVIDGVVYHDPSIKLVDISRGTSILSIWLEPPAIQASDNKVTFAGGIPGGYCGRIPGDPSLTNNVITLIFRSPGLTIGGGEAADQARVWVGEESQALLNDGLGTKTTLLLQDAYISLNEGAGATQQDEWSELISSDNQLPSDFVINLTRDDQNDDPAFSGRYFITFSAVDKQSGIDHYEVMEEPFSEFYSFKWGRADAPWITTESPYVLTDQSLNSTIRVKAVDKAGNERIEILVPDEAQRAISRDAIIFYSLVLLSIVLLVLLLAFALWKRRQRILMEEDIIHNSHHEHHS